MEASTQDPGTLQPIRWYLRSAVDEYLDSTRQRCVRLEATIAEANDRAEKARTTVGLQRMMATMVIDAQREINERRRDAEASATALIIAAEAEASAIIAEATAAMTSLDSEIDLDAIFGDSDAVDLITNDGSSAWMPESMVAPEPSPEPEPEPEPEPSAESARVVGERPASGPTFRGAAGSEVDEGDDEFFEYLRGSFGDAGRPGPLAE